MWPVGFGLTATAGTYFAGLSFVMRDAVQDTGGKVWVVAVIAIGAGLSYFISDALIATASMAAFACSETADFLVYTPLRRRGYIRAAVASNVVGAVVDTFVFLHVAGFGLAKPVVEGQLVGKLLVTGVVILLVALNRQRRAVTA
jgi:uncharacterized PurR-regulated membrane protein YhhQ (DUF165 family)